VATKPQKRPRAIPGSESAGAFVVEAVRAQERVLDMTQGWSEGVLGTLKEQADSYTALLRSVDASLRAMEQAITSQAQTTKALAGSLEASREVVSTVMSAHQHSIDRVETFLQGILDVLTGQLEALRMQVDIGQAMLSDPVAAQSATFMKMSQDWMEAYGRLMDTASGSFRPEGND
jgi:hypothetical protein